MIALTICIIVFVAGCSVYLAAQSRRRTVAELLADTLYALAAVTYSAAVAVDAAIVAYRRERERIRQEHAPQYAAREMEASKVRFQYDPVPDFLTIAGLRKPKNRTDFAVDAGAEDRQ